MILSASSRESKADLYVLNQYVYLEILLDVEVVLGLLVHQRTQIVSFFGNTPSLHLGSLYDVLLGVDGVLEGLFDLLHHLGCFLDEGLTVSYTKTNYAYFWLSFSCARWNKSCCFFINRRAISRKPSLFYFNISMLGAEKSSATNFSHFRICSACCKFPMRRYNFPKSTTKSLRLEFLERAVS